MKRRIDECYYDYQARRKMENDARKVYLKGRLIHCSSVMVNKGTALKPLWEKVKVQGTRIGKFK